VWAKKLIKYLILAVLGIVMGGKFKLGMKLVNSYVIWKEMRKH